MAARPPFALPPVRPEPPALNPEILPKAHETDPLIEAIAHWMDNAFRLPLGEKGYRFGLDPILGFIPVLGDVVTSSFSVILIARAVQKGVPKGTVARMATNVGVDALLTAIPFIGNVLDFAFKSNQYNLELYRQSLRGRRRNRADWVYSLGILVALIAVLSIPLILIAWVLSKVFPMLTGHAGLI